MIYCTNRNPDGVLILGMGDEYYCFCWLCEKTEDYNNVIETLKLVDQLPHYEDVVIVVVIPEWKYKMYKMEVHLFTHTLGKQKEFMETFRCVWKCKTGRDYSITGDITDWTGSVLRYAHENRHN